MTDTTPKNQINPRKLLQSKWTAVEPMDREKHFLVTEVEFDEEGTVTYCELEAVISHKLYPINWQDLKDASRWRQGWK
ncbi:TIGR02450 family Trp-rich protein [Oceanospirillum sp.]|uniref:TIGR02450 family Trp-rich protein n=1 Tax=Oceanospirillum sp. TaxID=2021254 RepID=UPI003A8CD5EC